MPTLTVNLAPTAPTNKFTIFAAPGEPDPPPVNDPSDPPPDGGDTGGDEREDELERYTGPNYALIMGLQKCNELSDACFAPESAHEWFDYLYKELDYDIDNIHLLVDEQVDYVNDLYPNEAYKYRGTEANVKFQLNWLKNKGGAAVISFIVIGHGGCDSDGNHLIACEDFTYDPIAGAPNDGRLYASELKDILGDAGSKKIFVFLDVCESGGFIDPLFTELGTKLFITTGATSTSNAYGSDHYGMGTWTWCFLQGTLRDHFGSNPDTTMEQAWTYAYETVLPEQAALECSVEANPNGDCWGAAGLEPQCKDGNPAANSPFYLTVAVLDDFGEGGGGGGVPPRLIT